MMIQTRNVQPTRDQKEPETQPRDSETKTWRPVSTNRESPKTFKKPTFRADAIVRPPTEKKYIDTHTVFDDIARRKRIAEIESKKDAKKKRR